MEKTSHTTNTFLTFLKFLVCIHAGDPRVPPRVLAQRPKPCGGNNLKLLSAEKHTYALYNSNQKQIENSFKDPEEKNSSEGIIGNSEVNKKFEASVVKLQLT